MIAPWLRTRAWRARADLPICAREYVAPMNARVLAERKAAHICFGEMLSSLPDSSQRARRSQHEHAAGATCESRRSHVMRTPRHAANESSRRAVSAEKSFVHLRFTCLADTASGVSQLCFTWLHNSLCGAGRLRCRGIADVAKQRQWGTNEGSRPAFAELLSEVHVDRAYAACALRCERGPRRCPMGASALHSESVRDQ
jgi:hypothetical protein